MDKNNVIAAVLLVIVAVIACIIAFTPSGDVSADNVISLDGVTFNTTKTTDFVKTDERNESGYLMKYYVDANGTGKSYVNILECKDMGLVESVMNAHASFPSQTVDDITVYTESGSTGEDLNETEYVSVMKGADNRIVIIGSPDLDETVKMASTLKLN